MRTLLRNLFFVVCCLVAQRTGLGQMVTGPAMPGFREAFGLTNSAGTKDFILEELQCSAPANIVWPGEHPEFLFRFQNKSDSPLDQDAEWVVVEYGTKSRPNDVWVPDLFKVAEHGRLPLHLEVGTGQTVELRARPQLPSHYAGFALVLDLGQRGRLFGAPFVQVLRPDPTRVQFPTYALDMPWPHEISTETYKTFQRLGVKGCRHGVGYRATTDPKFQEHWERLRHELKEMQEHNITVLLTIGEGGAPMPLGRPRPWLKADGTMMENVKEDYAWLPEYDADFELFCKRLTTEFGWPKGPVNAIELWNEPWEGVSISGWGADCLRFREMYEHMALGIEAGRREGGVEVLIGGACSSTNTRDKLFADGSNRFLKWLDFVSIHYQPLAADPALEPAWMRRKSPYGPVRVWDTESWIANSEDRVAAVIASMRSQGQSRTAGIYHGNVYEMHWRKDLAGKNVSVAYAWSPAVAVAASQQFIGQRPFREILFRNGLPWVYAFEGLQSKDDGTLVVLGDLGAVYDRNRTLFRGVRSLESREKVQALEEKLSAATGKDRSALEKQLEAAYVMTNARLVLENRGGEFVLFDFYGNPLPARDQTIVVPLNGLGYFLRTTGVPGSFSRLVAGIKAARIEGYEPVSVEVSDFAAPIIQRPTLRVRLSNILNRPIRGRLQWSSPGLEFEKPNLDISLMPHQTREILVRVKQGQVAPDNTYPLTLTFDAGADGKTFHRESMHVNVISRKAIQVDGDLEDWRGALPQPVGGAAIRASLTEKAWLPFGKYDDTVGSGTGVAFIAYDDQYFYFAAKVADSTPFAGGPRYASRDDDSYFYPETSYSKPQDGAKPLVWPAGVRRFTYRRNFEIPSGNDTDNFQIAFNVLPISKKAMLSHPSGTMPRYMAYPDTDYEFALNQVAETYGGGAEIYRLLAPGMPRKHFYPRQPKAPVDGGAVETGKLSMRREGNTRLVEAAIPWGEIPEVRKAMLRGRPVKFTYRVNDNRGPALELASGRSVSKENCLTFHNDWATHWANELEFSWEKQK